MTTPVTTAELGSIRQRLATARGTEYWRCLDELADHDGFQEWLRQELPQAWNVLGTPISRRAFLSWLGASLALAGLQGCSVQPPQEKIFPYVRQPEKQRLGVPRYFATAMTLGGYATGLLVESHEGRPTKVEGNPDHPASLGATDVFAQAAVLELYDPHRSQAVTFNGQTAGWDEAVAALRTALEPQRKKRGAGLRILTENITSPTLASQISRLLDDFPEARWHRHEPASHGAAATAAKQAFGRAVEPIYHFDKADVVFSLEADFLGEGPGHLRYAREFAARRRVRDRAKASVPEDSHAEIVESITPDKMSRLYVVECTPTLTGAKADHRWPLAAAQIESFARTVASKIDTTVAGTSTPFTALSESWLNELAADLRANRGKSLILVGEQQPVAVHLLAHAMNHALGNVGQTVEYLDPMRAGGDRAGTLEDLTDELARGRVELLVILGGNPVYSAPVDLNFGERMKEASLRFYWGLYDDETAAQCQWHIPATHFLESWSDARTFDGTATIVQPLIAPLYGGKSAHALLSVLLDPAEQTDYDLVRATWRKQWDEGGKEKSRHASFDEFWQRSLHDGVVAGSAYSPRGVAFDANSLRSDNNDGPSRQSAAVKPSSPDSLEIVFRLDPAIYDGRFASNGWLQELPKPLTKLTWGNAAMISPALAKKLGLNEYAAGHGGEHGEMLVDVVQLNYRGRTLEVPAWILPGQAENTVTLHLGYGRTRGAGGGQDVGANAYLLRDSAAPWFDGGLSIAKLDGRYSLACTQAHHQMEDRHQVRTATRDEYTHHPDFAREEPKEPSKRTETHGRPTLYSGDDFPQTGHQWGMAIDLGTCLGCNACVIACQAENNIPVVGKEQVMAGREMHWIRLDRYYQGPAENPTTEFQPVPCMHCENAPCELVCPVGATVHSTDGLNDMVYNRCVGTRYCSNNCPYKVRRFNFLQYADFTTESLKLLHNPEVTVRSRGVMEKCTYCVQRITKAKIYAERAGRPIRDGEIVTACQAACPAGAIMFGDVNDPASQVAQWKKDRLNYALLAELNTRPRTTYLAGVRNPNPKIEDI